MSADLAVIMRAGGGTTDAVRTALAQLADIYRTAWAQGVIPEGERPQLLAFQLYDPTTTVTPSTSRNAASADTRAVPRIGRHIPRPYPARRPEPVAPRTTRT